MGPSAQGSKPVTPCAFQDDSSTWDGASKTDMLREIDTHYFLVVTLRGWGGGCLLKSLSLF